MELPDGWIAHDGGAMPIQLPSLAPVLIMYRDGVTGRATYAAQCIWQWAELAKGAQVDIIAYKPEMIPDAR